MSEKIINIIRNSKKYSVEIADHLRNKLIEHGYSPTYEYSDGAELNISIGGDGSFLKSVRDYNFPSIPYIGLNTGTLGFYPELSPKDIDFFVNEYSNENYTINRLNLLKGIVNVENTKKEVYAINDISINSENCKTIHLDVYIDDNHLQTISGDGVVVSTPMGSSAYNYSSGGSIVYPSLNTMQVTPISPLNSNAYRCLNSGVIVPPDTNIVIKPEYKYMNSVVLCIDGNNCNLGKIRYCKFYICDKTINMLSLGKFNYWNVIKNKFL